MSATTCPINKKYNMFTIITSSITGSLDPAPAIAGSKAGAVGILDLTLCQDIQAALHSLNKLDRHALSTYGVKLDAVVDPFFLEVAASLPPRLSTVILAPFHSSHLQETVSLLRKHQVTIMLECTSLQDALSGQHCRVDGLIAKGNEAGGRVGEESTFVLLQKLKSSFIKPIWVHGGIGLHTASACHVAGASGIILDAQLSLARESPLPDGTKQAIRRQDGRKTQLIGEEMGHAYRMQPLAGPRLTEELTQFAHRLRQQPLNADDRLRQWRIDLASAMTNNQKNGGPEFLMLGQDIALAAFFADNFVTVGGIVQAVRQSVEQHCQLAGTENPLAPDSSMAKSHGTEFAIVQGPMARVSDVPQFALEVAKAGGLPFLAAAWLRRDELDRLLTATAKRLQPASWGVGLLGFLPGEVFSEQVEVLLKHRPPFALLAGGQPHQAKRLEGENIPTYVHIPTVALLDLFIDQGLRRFIFEGREAGGHVGPFCGFVLWEIMIQRLLFHAEKKGSLQGFHILFAGGIKDALSAAMIGAMAAPLTALDASIGLQVGSAYLFTSEAVTSGAIVPQYQRQMLDCQQTVLLETGPGHAVRCAPTPFATRFLDEKRRLLADGTPLEKAKEILEKMEQGRLRIAAKGLKRAGDGSGKPKLTAVDEASQHEEGIYMVGQMAALQTTTLSIAELHRDLAINSYQLLKAVNASLPERPANQTPPQPSDIAVIGLAGFFPLAPDVTRYWNNIVNSVNAIREIPKERWDYGPLFNEDRQMADRIYSKWGTFLDDIPFDPLHYGMPPKMVPSVEPLHLMALEAVRHAIRDAGYEHRPFDRERTAVTMGISGSGDLAQLYGFRTMLPMFFGDQAKDIVRYFQGRLPEWTEDSFPGILMNVAAGRIANRFDFGGMNTLVDGACASSLAALYSAVKELETGACDLAIAGGADCMQNPFTYMCFSKTHALSPRGICNTLDARADGIVIGEGIVTVVLKRLTDAERDGDRIYAVIKGMGASSDGKDRSLTAPGVKGQMRALRRAYAKAGFSASTLGLVEAHATGTAEGDRVEIESLSQILQAENTPPRNCAIGSVKSMIGHTKSAAGLASMVKTVLALHHKVLPPTLGVETPNPGLQKDDSPLYVNGTARPWFSPALPRRAGVNAFGFGGTNYHAVLEEYTGTYYQTEQPASFQDWPTELFCWQAANGGQISTALTRFKEFISQAENATLKDLAHARFLESSKQSNDLGQLTARLAIIATSRKDLLAKMDQAGAELKASPSRFSDPKGLFYHLNSPLADGRVAFLFPGQGSQYINMLAEPAIQFPFIHALFERSNRLLAQKRGEPLTSVIFPPQLFTEEEQRAQTITLAQTTTAQPAMGTADLALYHLLRGLGVAPDMVAGHSYGEYVALCVAGAMDEEDLITLSEARARFILEGTGDEPGGMAAVEANSRRVETVLAGMAEIWVANINAPDQTVISGKKEALQEAMSRFESQGIKCRQLPVGCAFHSPLITPACAAMTGYLEGLPMREPTLPVFSNVTATPHSPDPAAIKDSLVKHLVSGVRFLDQIENMYQAGARIFVECGPGRVLTGLTGKILEDRPHLAVISNQRGRSAFTQLHFALAELFVHGRQINLAPLFSGRHIQGCDQPAQRYSPTTWLVNGSSVRPRNEPPPQPLVPYHFQGIITPLTPAPPGQTGYPASPVPSVRSLQTPPPSDDRETAMLGFQQLMRHFLDTQQSIMTRFLTPGSGSAQPSLTQAPGKTAGTGHPDGVLTENAGNGAQNEAPSISPPAAEKSGNPQQTKDEQPAPALDPKVELMAIVSARTGYPPEMIDVDSDMEADLGIDSIKRVEILGEFLKGRDNGGKESTRPAVEKARTLRQILDWVRTTDGGAVRTQSDTAPPPGQADAVASQPSVTLATANPEAPSYLPRCLVIPVPLPAPDTTLPLPTSLPVLITDDGLGIAEALAAILMDNGCEVLLLRSGEQQFHSNQWTEYSLNGTDTTSLAAMIHKKHGGIGGLIHLSPLQPASSPFTGISALQWRQRLTSDLKPLFELLQLFAADLTHTRGVVAAVTSMGGNFGLDSRERADFFPGHGALCGFMKTLALEWPGVRIKAIDISTADAIDTIAKALFTELTTADPRVEIGLTGGKRHGMGIQAAPLAEASTSGLRPGRDWVIVITGGARGITARVAIELARQFKSTLILIGRSSAPATDQRFEHLATALEIKQAMIKEAQEQKQPLTVAEVEDACRRVLATREIREAMAIMEQAGSRVVYEQSDVTDTAGFSALLDRIHQQYGRIDGIIHGAGIIEDKLFADKKWESFARVFFTKADSTWVLANALPKIAPRFVAFFSSVAGTFGNRGQCDYAAANEVMNKTALWLDRHWPGRAVALNWGPWAGSGMASPEVQQQFLKRGVHLVGQDEGALAFLRELTHGQRREVEVLLGDGPWVGLAASSPSTAAMPPLLHACAPRRAGQAAIIHLTLDLREHRYLNDHRLDGFPVLPAAMAVEIMAETGALLHPDWQVTAIRDIRVLKGIVIDRENREIVVSARETDSSDDHSRQLAVGISEMEGGRLFYSGTVELRHSSAPPGVTPPDPGLLKPLGMSIGEAYENWLFHGPLFQCITAIEGINDQGLRATLLTSRPDDGLARETNANWLADPVLLDGGLQLSLIWTRFHRDMTMLPSAMKAVQLYHPFSAASEVSCQVEVVESPHRQAIIFNLYFTDEKGVLLGMIERFEATGSKALNRLTGNQGDNGGGINA